MVVTGGRGWTSSTPGHLHTAPSFCRGHGDVTHGGLGEFVSCPYFFPQHCIPEDSPLEEGCSLIIYLIGNKNTEERENDEAKKNIGVVSLPRDSGSVGFFF